MNGFGVPEDYGKARQCFEKAENQVYDPEARALAWFYLGHLYYGGSGVPKDDVRARLYWEKAATQTIDLEVQADAKKLISELDRESN